MRHLLVFALLVFFVFSKSQTVQYYQTGEEFAGPFPSWKNVKTDFGAVGDGVTNDGPAIKAALMAMKNTSTNTFNVLYFPAGIYKIDSTMYNFGRTVGDHYSGMALIGEDPSNTIIRWGGNPAGNMFELNGWYCRVSRLTFDGMNSASRGIYHNGGFGTGCEFSDIIFKDFSGLQGGGVALDFSSATNGQAENAVLRCKFVNCKYGVLSCNWNSLDQWIWHCLFQDCKYAINLCTGYFQIYGNVFINSKAYDIGGGNTYQSAVVSNTSINSPCFFEKGPGFLRSNRIYTNIDTFKTVGAVFTDNIFRVQNNVRPVMRISSLNIIGDQNLFVGNTFTNAKRVYPFRWPVQPPRQNFDHAIGAAYIVNHPIEKAIDNNNATYFTTGLWQNAAGLRWNTMPANPRIVTTYKIRQGGSLSEAPKNFQFRASNDWGKTWTVLDNQTNQVWTNSELKTFTVNNTQAYSLYEFNILSNASNVTPGSGGWVSFAEAEFLDALSFDITEDTTGLLTGADESWGQYYPINNTIVDSSAVVVPSVITLPGTPTNYTRTVFEVKKNTGNDAAAIQQKLDSAALLPLGQKPVVHIPKGTFSVATTLTVAALKDLQIIGDGVGSGFITNLNWTGNNTGPLIKFLGPSRATVKDIQFQIQNHQNAGMDVILVEDADQNGGRVYANQLFAGSVDPAHPCSIGIYADEVENSDITIICSSPGSASNALVKAKGGPVLSTGGNTNGQISMLSGAFGGTQNIFGVEFGGRIAAEGMWYEGYPVTNNSGLLNLNNTSGRLTVSCMQWYLNNTNLPVISTNSFTGKLNLINNSFNQVPRTMVQMNGTGNNCEIFSGFNFFGSGTTFGVTTDSIWGDNTSPNGKVSLMNCVGGQGNSYKRLDYVVDKVHNIIPDTNRVLNGLAQIRNVKVEAPFDKSPGVTDLKFFRIASRAVEGNIAVHFKRGLYSSLLEYAGSGENELLLYPNPSMREFNAELKGKVFSLELFDVMGRKLIELPANPDKISVDCKNLPAGIYYVKTTDQYSKTNTGKVIIVR